MESPTFDRGFMMQYLPESSVTIKDVPVSALISASEGASVRRFLQARERSILS